MATVLSTVMATVIPTVQSTADPGGGGEPPVVYLHDTYTGIAEDILTHTPEVGAWAFAAATQDWQTTGTGEVFYVVASNGPQMSMPSTDVKLTQTQTRTGPGGVGAKFRQNQLAANTGAPIDVNQLGTATELRYSSTVQETIATPTTITFTLSLAGTNVTLDIPGSGNASRADAPENANTNHGLQTGSTNSRITESLFESYP